MTYLKHLLSLAAAGSLLVGGAGLAFAQDSSECASDDDCEEGFSCEVTAAISCPGSPPCPEGEECPEPPECEEEEFTECVRAPIECDTDSDCPDFLSCVTDSPPTICTVEPGGEEECEEPEPGSEESFCAYVPLECETDADCPDNFECISFGASDCPSIACPEGEECPEVECDETEEFACVPQQIECDTDSDCPDEWACQTFEQGSCSGEDTPEVGGGGVPDEGEGDSGEGGEGEQQEEEDDDCEEETISACIPPGFEDGVGGGVDLGGERQNDSAEEGNPSANGPDDEDANADEEETDGCSVAAGQPSQSTALLFLLAGLAFVARRRRA